MRDRSPMSNLTTYRINLYAADAHDYDTGESGPIGRMILDGVLVPVESLTPRLQAIADAPKCKHGYVYPHQYGWDVTYTSRGEVTGCLPEGTCPGSPELADLLDALEGTDNDYKPCPDGVCNGHGAHCVRNRR